MVVVQAPEHAAFLAREAARRSQRVVAGLAGPWAQVLAVRDVLGLASAPVAKAGREDLYGLDLHELIVPSALLGGGLRCRHAELAVPAGSPPSRAPASWCATTPPA